MTDERQPEPFAGLQTTHVVLILVAAVFLVFGRALDAGFVDWDDNFNLLHNERVHGLDGERLGWMFTNLDQAMRYKPLNWLTWACIYAAQGLAPRGYHLANILFHAGSTLLLFHLVRRLLAGRTTAPGPASRRANDVVAGLATLMWAIHPLRAEPVAWVTGLPYCQALFLMLTALLAYLESAQSASAAMSRRWYWGSVGTFALAAFTYPVVAPFPVVLLLVDAAVTRRLPAAEGGWLGRDALKVYQAKLPFVLITVASLGPTLWARFFNAGIYYPAASLSEFSVLARTMQAFYCWAYFTWRPFLPFDLTPFPTSLMDFAPLAWPNLVSAGAVLLVTGALWARRREWPDLWLTWGCHLLVLVPVLGLTEQAHYTSDRYTYVAGVLWVPWLAGLMLRLSRWPAFQPSAGPVALAVCLVLAVGSFRQTGLWRDSYTLFTGILDRLGDSPYRHEIQWRLGIFYYDNGFPDKGRELFHALVVSNYPNPTAHAAIGDFLLRHSDFAPAAPHFRVLLQSQPEDPLLHAKIGVALARSGQAQMAVGHLEKSLAQRPGQPELRQLLKQITESPPRPATPSPP